MRIDYGGGMLKQILASLALLAAAATARAQDEETVHHAFDVQIMQTPVVVPGPNGPHLVYELHLTNFASSPLTLTRVDVSYQDGGSTLATYEGPMLEAVLASAGPLAPEANRRAIAPGARAILYMSVPTNGVYEPPSIGHRIFFERVRDGVTSSIVVAARETALEGRDLPVLGPPLRGGPWVAVYHPDWERGHRRVFYAVEGRARLPGRFAIDWMRAGDGDGRGAEVLAVADGTVVAMRDDFADAGDDLPATLSNATGNYVAINIGDGRFAFYEHLAQDVRVNVGQRVRRGQVLGVLGATGSVTRPHLHFHLADANAPLEAEGLPYVLRYRPLGEYETIEAFNTGSAWREGGGLITPSFPAPMMVVEFPQ